MPLSGVILWILSLITLRNQNKSFGTTIPRAKPLGWYLRIFLFPSGMIKYRIPRSPQDNATFIQRPLTTITMQWLWTLMMSEMTRRKSFIPKWNEGCTEWVCVRVLCIPLLLSRNDERSLPQMQWWYGCTIWGKHIYRTPLVLYKFNVLC